MGIFDYFCLGVTLVALLVAAVYWERCAQLRDANRELQSYLSAFDGDGNGRPGGSRKMRNRH